MTRVPESLAIRLLGPLEVRRDGELVELPPSKKTRALLSYLVLTRREHRRERLCALFWDVTDDPRGALRWSLSKLRQLVDDDTRQRLVADRNTVAIDASNASVDLLELRRLLRGPRDELSLDGLVAVVDRPGGELCEGLDLDDFHEFQGWLAAERTEARRDRQLALSLAIERLAHDPERALPLARRRVEADPLDEASRVALVELLLGLGRTDEAAQHVDSGLRLAAELGGVSTPSALEAARRRVRAASAAARFPRGAARQPPPAAITSASAPSLASSFSGRADELARLEAVVADVCASRKARLVLLTGEPGVGKSRLLDELVARVSGAGVTVLRGRAFEIEGRLPYGPWRELLGGGASDAPTREVLFSRVVSRIAERCAPVGALLLLDDVQWMDADSCELLHFVVRAFVDRPLSIVVAARPGELEDNDAATTLLRGLRRATSVDEIELGPLSRPEIGAMLGLDDAALDEVHRASAGNPLFALELARGASCGGAPVPATVTDAVRERIARLPAAAVDVLRWGSALGHAFTADQVTELVALEPTDVVDAIEALQRHGLVRLDEIDGCTFTHDVVRLAVYHQLSAPRRRLMHRRIAGSLGEKPASERQIAALAHHAVLGGDAALAVEACLRAGDQALRVFAAAEAEALARRGLALVGQLEDVRARLSATIDLHRVRLAARRPNDPATTGRELERLADDALDHGLLDQARLAFHMLAFLRWDHGPGVGDAMTPMLELERLSRGADERRRAYALAEAARCLVLLERDLPHAEALALEAQALSSRGTDRPSTLPLVVGMLEAHRGEQEQAERHLREAYAAMRAEGDRLAELRALEALVMFEIDRERWAEADEHAAALLRLGERIRVGSEAPAARALVALVRLARGEGSPESLDAAIGELRAVDAKYRLAFVCNRAARLALARGPVERAAHCAREALQAAQTVSRASEIALARVTLARAELLSANRESALEQVAELRRCSLERISRRTRQAVDDLVAELAR